MLLVHWLDTSRYLVCQKQWMFGPQSFTQTTMLPNFFGDPVPINITVNSVNHHRLLKTYPEVLINKSNLQCSEPSLVCCKPIILILLVFFFTAWIPTSGNKAAWGDPVSA
jgi:hypothetical protein